MRIAVLGAGAMGTLFGTYLASCHDVLVVDVSEARIASLQSLGGRIIEKETTIKRELYAVTNTEKEKPADIVLLFVKSMFSEEALKMNAGLIGPQTYVMTLQNGAGHENALCKFVPKDHIILGTTQHNASLSQDGSVYHGGSGETIIGLLSNDVTSLWPIAAAFTDAGIHTTATDDIQYYIWRKIMTNTSASALTAIFQMPLGFILENENAHALMEKLVYEAVTVANRMTKTPFCASEEIERVNTVLANARDGYTSICMDIKNGRRTEVDAISGYVSDMARQFNITAPYHDAVVAIIRALQTRK